ncbi:hypothetical protein WMY93_013419 [Mugilogobius chulae]|uniref:Uncharacterized protein n=1 Tax=Mugilogobius chulae TaxID=88201 RepID=A0AAW0P1M0_9GOBI
MREPVPPPPPPPFPHVHYYNKGDPIKRASHRFTHAHTHAHLTSGRLLFLLLLHQRAKNGFYRSAPGHTAALSPVCLENIRPHKLHSFSPRRQLKRITLTL